MSNNIFRFIKLKHFQSRSFLVLFSVFKTANNLHNPLKYLHMISVPNIFIKIGQKKIDFQFVLGSPLLALCFSKTVNSTSNI